MSSLKHLKTLLLLVDEIAIVEGRDSWHFLEWHLREEHPRLAADLDWLEGRGVVRRVDISAILALDAVQFMFTRDSVIVGKPSDFDHLKMLPVAPSSSKKPEIGRPYTSSDLANITFDTCCRLHSQELARSGFVKAISLHAPSPRLMVLQGSNTIAGDVLSVVIKALPEPDDHVPLEHILEFRQDTHVRGSLLGLRRWMSKLPAASSPGEYAQELEWLLHQYEEYMHLHKMKTNKGTLETFVTIGAEIAEDILKIKWGTLAKLLFTASSQKLEVMEAEMNAPSRDIAYVVHARKAFARK